jgi:hypothetical protein
MFMLRCSSWGGLLLRADGTTREESSVETNGHLLLVYMRLEAFSNSDTNGCHLPLIRERAYLNRSTMYPSIDVSTNAAKRISNHDTRNDILKVFYRSSCSQVVSDINHERFLLRLH